MCPRWIPALSAVVWSVWIFQLGTSQTRRVVGLSEWVSEPVLHLVSFAVLGALVMSAVQARPWVVLVALVAVGVAGEFVQLTAAGRSFGVADIAANAIGAALGVTLVTMWPGWQSSVASITAALVLIGSSWFMLEVTTREIASISFPQDCLEAPAAVTRRPKVIMRSIGLKDRDLPSVLATPSAEEVRERVLATNELTVETWFAPSDLVEAGPERVFTISGGPTIGLIDVQVVVFGDDLSVRLRTSCELFNRINVRDVLSADTPQHAVFTWSEGRIAVWLNGRPVAEAEVPWGDFERWDPDYRVVVGGEAGGAWPFAGTVHSVTMWDGPLDDDEIIARSQQAPQG